MSQNRKTNESFATSDAITASHLRFPFSLIQTLGVAVIILDLQGRITHFNRAAELSSSYRSNEVVGRRPWDFLISQEDAQILEQSFETLKSSGLQTEMDTVWITRDGKRRTFHWSNAPVQDENGKLRWVVDVFVDITEAKASELHLSNAKKELEAERLMSQFLAEASYRIYTSNLAIEKRMELLSALPVPTISDWSFLVLQGREPGAFLKAAYHWDYTKSESISKLLSSKTNNNILRFISKARSHPFFPNGDIAEVSTPEEMELLKVLGWCYWICIPIEGVHPRTRGAFLLASATNDRNDLRNCKQTAEELIRRVTPLLDQANLYEDTIQAIQMRDEFIATASHELRTPLTSLRMQMELLKNQPTAEFITSPMGQKLISSAVQQLNKLSKLVMDMLDTVYISLGKIRLKPERFDLRDLVQSVVNQLKAVASLKGVVIQMKLNTPVVGNWDKFRLEQLLVNLIVNAINFGKSKPLIVKTEASQKSAFIEVEDHGPGIRLEDRERIFDRFQQVSSSASGGLGLGLYIARQIARSHGGDITVESQLNQGSKFIVELPR